MISSPARDGDALQSATDRSTICPRAGAAGLRIVSMGHGTVRAGLRSDVTRSGRAQWRARRARAKLAPDSCLADVKDETLYTRSSRASRRANRSWCARSPTSSSRQQAFLRDAGRLEGRDIEKVGGIFRADGIGLRDEYQISGPELETMCDIARTGARRPRRAHARRRRQGRCGALVLGEPSSSSGAP